VRLPNKEKDVESTTPRATCPAVASVAGEMDHGAPGRVASPFEVAYSLFFVLGIGSVLISLVVPGILKRTYFVDPNDVVIYVSVIVIVVMVIFQLSRIYFVLHHISGVADNTEENFLLLLERPWIDHDKVIKFILAAVIIASPKFNFLQLFWSQHSMDVMRQSALSFPQVYNVDEVNAVLWDGAGYCFSLAICFYILILWDLNVFWYYVRSTSNESASPEVSGKFCEFFYINAIVVSKVSEGTHRYLLTWKFLERLTGLLFSVLMIIFITDWYMLWLFVSIVSAVLFWVIIVFHHEHEINHIFRIFRKPFQDLAGMLSVLIYYGTWSWGAFLSWTKRVFGSRANTGG
jgi:hypothetical protein